MPPELGGHGVGPHDAGGEGDVDLFAVSDEGVEGEVGSFGHEDEVGDGHVGWCGVVLAWVVDVDVVVVGCF